MFQLLSQFQLAVYEYKLNNQVSQKEQKIFTFMNGFLMYKRRSNYYQLMVFN